MKTKLEEAKKHICTLHENTSPEGMRKLHPEFTAAKIASSYFDPHKEQDNYAELYNYIVHLFSSVPRKAN